jgi:nitrate reductase delta subunit
VFSALQRIANASADGAALGGVEEEDDDPNDLEALDKVWVEKAVSFGPSRSQDCSADRVAARIRAALRPAHGRNIP